MAAIWVMQEASSAFPVNIELNGNNCTLLNQSSSSNFILLIIKAVVYQSAKLTDNSLGTDFVWQEHNQNSPFALRENTA